MSAQKIFNVFVTMALAIVTLLAACHAASPAPIPTAPVVLDIGEVRDASPSDWAELMDTVRSVSIDTNRPITISLQSWDFCSECDSQVPLPAESESLAIEAGRDYTVTMVHTGTVTINHVVTGTVKTAAPAEVTAVDPCAGFMAQGPGQVTSGETFTVTAILPEGVQKGWNVLFTPYNVAGPPDLCVEFLTEGQTKASCQLVAPDRGEIWLAVAVTLRGSDNLAICQEITLVDDPPATE